MGRGERGCRRRGRRPRSGWPATGTPTPSGRERPTPRATEVDGTSPTCRAAGRRSSRGGLRDGRAATLTVRSRPDTCGLGRQPAAQGRHRGRSPAGRSLADGYTLVPGRRADHDVGPGRACPERQLGRRVAGQRRPTSAHAGAEHDDRRRRDLGPVVRCRRQRQPRPSAAARAARAFSPNGDGSEDGLVLRWTNRVAFDSLVLRVFRADGTSPGRQRARPRARRPGLDVGRIRRRGRLPDGQYAIQLLGRAGGATYTAPSIAPLGTTQVLRFAVTIDTAGPRLTGARLRAGWYRRPATAGTTASPGRASSAGATRWRLTAAPIVRRDAGRSDQDDRRAPAASRGRRGTAGPTPGSRPATAATG